MTTLADAREEAPWYGRLYEPAYQVSDAARYAGASPQAVAYWHYGRDPVLPDRVRKQPLSYLELVEVAFVAYFRSIGIRLQRIRRAREYIANQFGARYPFTEYKFKTEGYHILMDYHQVEANSDFSKVIVTDAAGQLAWSDLVGQRFAEFDYDLDLALTWHPGGRNSLVKVDPRTSFGTPVVRGIATRVISGRWKAGESLKDLKDDFGLSKKEIEDALRFEGLNPDGNGHCV